MKRWKLCDLVPPGTSGELQGLLCLLVMICAFLYSVWKYAAALTHGLETAARSLHRMTDFADLIGAQSDSASFWTPPVFFPLTLVVLAALLLIPCNYYAFWRGAKSIYLMRRLPDRWEFCCGVRSVLFSLSKSTRPLSTILPRSGVMMPAMHLSVTLLPQPDSPTSPTILPRGMARSTPSTAARGPSGVRNSVRRPVMVRVFCRASTVFPPLPGFLHSVSLAQAAPLGNSFAPRSLRQRSSAKIPAKNF